MSPKKRLAVVEEPEPEEDEVEDEVDEDEEEVATPVRKKLVTKTTSKKHVVEEDDEDDEEETPKKSLKKKGSLAKAFESVPLTNNAEDVEGKHEAILAEAFIAEPKANGQFCFFKYQLCEEEFAGKNELTKGYKLLDAEMEPIEFPIRQLKQDLAKLGYEPESLEECEEILEEITKEKPGVLITVTPQKEYPEFPRIKIEGPCDNEIVEAYKDNIAF